MATHLASRVSLYLQALGLKQMDRLSQNDVFVVVYYHVRENKNSEGEYKEIHRTETISETLTPEWAEAINVDYHFEEVQKLKFEVYDRDGKSDNLKKHDLIGTLETTMSKIMGAKGGVFSGLLADKKGREGKRGKLIIRGQEIADNKDLVEWKMRAENLAKKNMMGFGASDPFYIFSMKNPAGGYQPVFKSEVLKKSSKPVWKPHRQFVTTLCNGDYDMPLKLEVFDWESSGNHKLIGSMEVSLNEMRDVRPMELKDLKGKKAGTVIFDYLRVEERSTFLEYIAGGLEIKLSVAIDFTASNKPPDNPQSLHYRSPDVHFSGASAKNRKLNEYQQAIVTVGQILQDYDADKMIPAFGFGAQGPKKKGFDMHCFPLTLDQNKVEVEGIAGIMAAYEHCLNNISLSGPTHFGSIIQNAVDRVKECSDTEQAYEVLLILTDGMINDMEATMDAIVAASNKAMSIVIVGVGDADFSGMEELDADGNGIVSNGKAAIRDMVQFVPYRKFDAQSYTALAEETMKEVPTQVEQFFRIKKIDPMQPREADPANYEVPVAEAVEVEEDDE